VGLDGPRGSVRASYLVLVVDFFDSHSQKGDQPPPVKPKNQIKTKKQFKWY